MFQSILDCSDTQELVEAQMTLTRQEKVEKCSKRKIIIFMKHRILTMPYIIIKIAISRIHQIIISTDI